MERVVAMPTNFHLPSSHSNCYLLANPPVDQEPDLFPRPLRQGTSLKGFDYAAVKSRLWVLYTFSHSHMVLHISSHHAHEYSSLRVKFLKKLVLGSLHFIHSRYVFVRARVEKVD